jgi:hypothetical protein
MDTRLLLHLNVHFNKNFLEFPPLRPIGHPVAQRFLAVRPHNGKEFNNRFSSM